VSASDSSYDVVEVAFGILTAIVLLALPLIIWRKAILSPYRSAKQRLERLSADVNGLSVVNANTDSPAEPSLFSFSAAWPVARGQRGGLALELLTRHGYKYDRPFTLVNVTRRGRSGPELGSAHAFTFRYLHALAKNPVFFAMRRALEPADRRTVQTEWMGDAVAWGPPQAFDRFFDAHAQNLLRSFPRELSYVSFDGDGTISILWYEIEQDGAVVELAFDLGAALLENGARVGVLR
jgi:hypothetical protein